MTRVTLELDGTASSVPPGDRVHADEAVACRLQLSSAALELAAAIAGVHLPWQELARPATGSLEAALGPTRPDTDEVSDTVDPALELRRAGLLDGPPDGAGPHPWLRSLLLLLAGGEVRVDADLVVRRRTAAHGAVRLRSWHRLHGDRFAAVSTTDGRTVELGWGADAAWPAVLTHLATVQAEPTAVPGLPSAPGTTVELPWDILLASGRAVRERRGDLLRELAARAAGRTWVADGDGTESRLASATDIAEQLQLLHLTVRGRLQVTVGGVGGDGPRRLGLVSWLLFPDGWRSLVPVPAEEPRVLVRSCRPQRLAVEVAAQVTGVRS